MKNDATKLNQTNVQLKSFLTCFLTANTNMSAFSLSGKEEVKGQTSRKSLYYGWDYYQALPTDWLMDH